MKRLISWLLALTLIVGLLPMSVFAVEVETENGDDNFVVDMWELQAGGSEANPYMPTFTMNEDQTEGTATVTIPAGKTMYLYSYQVGGMNMVIGEGEATLCEAAPRQAYYWTITNDTEAEAEYVITISYPVGHQMNPAELVIGDNEAAIAAGDTDGYYYTYTATGDDTLSLTIAAADADGNELGWNYVVHNLTTYVYGESQWSDSATVVNPALVEVAAGDEIQVIVNTYNPEDSWNAPAGTVTVTAEIVAGSQSNAIFLSQLENTVTNAGTMYYYGYFSGTIMTITGAESAVYNGETLTADENGVISTAVCSANPRMPVEFSVTGDAEIKINFAYPEGSQSNPAILQIGENVASIEAGSQGYYYTYTAEQDGTLTITMPEGEWTYAIHNITAGTYGDTQWSDSDPVVNPGSVEVTAGDEIKIIVNTYASADPWNAPAGDLTITAAFEAAGPVEDANLKFLTQALSLKSGIIAQFIMTDPVATYSYDSVKLVVERAGETFDVTEYQTSNGMIAFEVGFTAKMMTEKATITIYAEKDGVTYIGESLVDWTIKQKAIEMLDNYYPSYVVGGTDSKTLTCNLVANMLAYGAAAQNHFAYNTDDLATDGLKDEYLALIIEEAPEMTAITIPSDSADNLFVRKITSLSLGANIQLQVGYALPSDVTITDYHAVIVNKDRGTEYEHVALQVNGNYAVVFFDGITAQQLRETLQITIYQGETAVSSTLELSVENLAAGMLSKYPELIPAMMNYSDCAKARFGS